MVREYLMPFYRWKIILGVVLTCTLAACSSVNTFSTQVSAFNNWPTVTKGNLYAFNQDFSHQLEQKSYAEIIAQEMWRTGLVRTENIKKARFLLNFKTQIETREQVVEEYSEDPLLLPQIGFLNWWGSPWGVYQGFNMMYVPRIERYSVRYHVYSLVLEIKDRAGHPVYQSKATAQSRYASLHEVMPFLASAIFENFPQNGVHTIQFDMDKSVEQNRPIRFIEKQ